MDIKITGLNAQILAEALEQARKGRLYILDKMDEVARRSRARRSAIRASHHHHQDSIPTRFATSSDQAAKSFAASSRRPARRSMSKTTAASPSPRANGEAARGRDADRSATSRPKPKSVKTYLGTVTRIVDFGAFVEIFPGTDGLLHVSEIADYRVRDVRDELNEGQQILVKCIGVEGNKIRLSRKALTEEGPQPPTPKRRASKQPAGRRRRSRAAATKNRQAIWQTAELPN